ncbi:conserved hypothetical protein [Methanocella paludicola SANAE]|uniref:Squalene cyclase C-terminal domain-containing protein n=1 Tax=Methanocella paludicola (strain DSM 17711 / JCM 13418 / NBRC 101707 / SANAE) TaxID=304371 RepID=D1Z1N7_METPS|nr:prenyltransferase/squalene oxidase repeat-containing protein [Methanocella paludicola]BAI62609.1 conserved hypothetical protein [Methanocella paludicola SANAE]
MQEISYDQHAVWPCLAELYGSLLESTLEYLIVEGDYAYVHDPYFNLNRCRVTAEVCKSMIRSGGNHLLAEKMVDWLVSRQNDNGSWNELHPRFSKPSALVTSFVAETLLLKKRAGSLSGRQEQSLRRAAEYVLCSEVGPGYFRKNASYMADYLNVDASCGAFLAHYGQAYHNPTYMEAALRAADNCIGHQASDGTYPYTTSEGGTPERYPLDVPCAHYQGVTIYYLAKLQKCIRDRRLESSIRHAGGWLASIQGADGSFDWSRSGLMFAYYLSGAYAFAAAAFDYCDLTRNRGLSITKMIENKRSIMNRWEGDSFLTLPRDAYTTYRSSMVGSFPARHRLFRFCYGLYRQCARRRQSDRIEDGPFNVLSKIFNIKTSTIDPFANYPDLFMTSEALDCLGYMLYG